MSRFTAVRWAAGVFAAVLAAAVITWQVTGFGLGHWLQVHLGVVNEAGVYYGFFSGSGSDLGEVTIVAGLATIAAGLWHKFNCHNEKCWRFGIHHVAGGQYAVCRKHLGEITGHPHRKLSTGFLRCEHQLHLDRLSRVPGGYHEHGDQGQGQ